MRHNLIGIRKKKLFLKKNPEVLMTYEIVPSFIDGDFVL